MTGDRGEILVPLAERYLKAVANRNRFSHRYGIELAQATLAAFGQAEMPPAFPLVQSPAGAPAPALRPGLARARSRVVDLDEEQLVAAGDGPVTPRRRG